MRPKIEGSGVAIVTPFHNGEIDYDALGKLLDFQIDQGTDFIVSLGTTGEAASLSLEEASTILAFTKKYVNGRVPLVAGHYGGYRTQDICRRLKEDDLEGFAAIMSSSPNYVKPSQEGIFEHYVQIEKASPLPIIIYNVPSRTGSNVEAKTTLRLAAHSEKFIAVKEASGDLHQAIDILAQKPQHFSLLSGDDPISLPLCMLGAEGGISVIANAFPKLFADIIKLGRSSKNEEAVSLNNQIKDIHPFLYKEANPCGIKALMEILGLCKGEVRLPLVRPSKSLLESLEAACKKNDLL